MGITPSNIEYALFFRRASIGDDGEFFHMDLRQRGGRNLGMGSLLDSLVQFDIIISIITIGIRSNIHVQKNFRSQSEAKSRPGDE